MPTMLNIQDLEKAAAETLAQGRSDWLLAAQPVLEAAIGDGLASATPNEMAKQWSQRRFRRALERAQTEEQKRVEQAILELRAEMNESHHHLDRLKSMHTISHIAIIADFIAVHMGHSHLELHVLCALVFLIVEFAEWVAPSNG
jgi:hypothetical protein